MVQKKSKDTSMHPRAARARGRPRQYDPEEALANAAAAFWKQGYAATSLDDLVAATGMNRPSLYAAFGDKRDLYLDTLKRYQQQSRAIGAQITADDPPLRVFLKRFYEAALDVYLASGETARGCYSISTAPAQAATDPAVRDFLAASISGTDAFVAKQIAGARERGEIPTEADPQALAQLATAALHSTAPAQAATDPAVRDFLAASIAGTDAFVAKQIAGARERGEIPTEADPQALAQLATAALHTIAIRARVGVPPKQLRAVAAAAIDVICGPQKS